MSTSKFQKVKNFITKKKKKEREFTHISKILRQYLTHFYMVIIAIIISSSAILTLSRVVRHIVDNGFFRHNIEMINKSCIIMLFLVVMLTVGSIMRLQFITKLGNNLTTDLRRKLYSVIINMPQSDIDKAKHGDLSSIILQDTETVYNIITGPFSSAIRNSILALGSMIMMLSTSVRLSIFTFVYMPVMLAPIIILGSKAKKEAKISQNASGKLFVEVEDAINNIHLTKSYSREEMAEKKFAHTLEQKLISAAKHSMVRSSLVAIVLTLAFGGIVALVWLSGHEIVARNLTGGEVSSFIVLLVVCGASLGSVADASQDVGKLFGLLDKFNNFLKKYQNILAYPQDNPPIDYEQFKKDHKATIEIKNLTFCYNTRNSPSLKQVSFEIEEGKITALVGESGSGKSTLVKLLLRLYEYQEGQINYNDIPLKSIPTAILREDIAYVSQDNYILSDSIYQNILYGKPQATMEEVEAAAKAAAASDFISIMPQGIMTHVGEKGVQLSGGQKQRICIARAMIRDSRLVLFDEATSSLDDYNENKIHSGINNLLKSKTTLVVTHSLTTILKADKIVVLREGEVVQIGKHDELVKDEKGEYYRLLNSGELFFG